MKSKTRWADNLSYFRIAAATAFAIVLSFKPEIFGWSGFIIITFIFLLDSLDGYIARRFDKPQKSGEFLDIASDRITENVLLVPFTYLGIASPIILIYFIAKGFLVDFVRLNNYMNSGATPFNQSQKKYFVLVKGRFMRALYGVIKVVLVVLFYAKASQIIVFKEEVYTIVSALTILISLIRTIPSLMTTN